ncbi:hypothetical protein AVEN_250472-1 [Araneus ventricosus]|uniref:Uncharacterized protein n=2 Tax=Araneus ventricosus TaxID=182803 RepID=A0A4Y2D0U2_ARAVE|nr:hypothetical protein AVEN_250472-1 [Araneus ventricosus]
MGTSLSTEKVFINNAKGLEISTRVGSAKGGFIQPYSTWNTGGVVKGNSDTRNDHFRREDPAIPIEIWIIICILLFIFLLMCIYCATACQMRRRRLWRDTRANSSRTGFETSPPGIQEDVRTSVGDSDAPPDYTAVVEQKTMAANDDDSLSHYPNVVGGKKLETPPPAYITVAPFK